MGVTKTTITEGNGAQPVPGDSVTIEYTGWLANVTNPGKANEVWTKGQQFDSSVGRGDFVTPIGTKRVIRGWDEGVPQMKVGEKATLNITSDFAYGAQEIKGVIPENAALIFDVELKAITPARR